MSRNDRSTRGREYRDHRSEKDRFDVKDRETRRRRRHRSPSYDSSSSSDSDSYDSDSSREYSRRPSRRHTAAYSDGEGRRDRGREHRRREREYHSEESPERERGGIVEDLLAAVGLIQSKHKDGGSRRDRSGPDSDERKKNTREALQAALAAAAMEAFRTRKEGKLTPQRLMQIAGAAIAAGGLDVLIDRSGGSEGGTGGSMKSIVESVVAGLATSKTMGKKVKHKRDESTGNKLGAGVVGMAAKHLARSMSQGPRRSRTTKY
ncbi:hypothetical protein ABW20_dc0104680 [Dactylellina cionopaga]|nr:hypothetical protein ABW20_dc0104680 [Dactylellina cionopaga]